jgi:uncharacterized protein (TIGR02001 family)
MVGKSNRHGERFEIYAAGRYSFAASVRNGMIVCKRNGSSAAWMLLGVAMALLTIPLRAELPESFSVLPNDDSVYAPPSRATEDQGSNQGGVNLDLTFAYMSDYIYRGVDHTAFPSRAKKPDIQFDGKVEFNTGKLPHPFVGIFADIYDNDPMSRFQEIRPYAGLNWTIRPVIIEAGVNSYIYPEREKFNTGEAYLKLTFDDSSIFKTEHPVFSPYVYAAYDYDKNNGFYYEAGLKHDFVIQDTGVTFTVLGDVAYISHIREMFILANQKTYGWQHYDVGLIGTYQLNQLLHLARRYGEINLQGYLWYTDGLDHKMAHVDKLWGGIGLQFKY